MRDTYYTSKEKTALSIAIANKERHILQDLDYQKGYSLYVGIPFCPSICLYCSFSSSPISVWKDKVDAYLDALCKEIEYGAKEYADRKLDTVYILSLIHICFSPNSFIFLSILRASSAGSITIASFVFLLTAR